MAISTRRILGSYLPVVRTYPLTFTASFLFFAVGQVLSRIFVVLYIRDLIDLITDSDPSQVSSGQVWLTFGYIAAYTIAANICWRIGDFSIVYCQSRALRDLNNIATNRLLQHSYSFFTGSFTGSLVAKVRRYVRSFETIHDKLVFNFGMTGVEILGTLVVLSFISLQLTIFFILWLVCYLAVAYAFVYFRRPLDRGLAASDSKVTGDIADMVTGVLNIKMFSSTGREERRFRAVTDEELSARRKAWGFDNWFRTLQAFTMMCLEVGGLYFAVRLWLQGTISAGTIVLIQAYFISISVSAWNIRQAMSDFFRAMTDALEMVEIMSTPPGVQDAVEPVAATISKGSIEFQAVHFGYGDSDVLTDFSFQIPAGQKIGLVGHSGAGKSTVFKLLMRFIDIDAGRITIDGQDIQQLRQDDLRHAISYVPQDTILFHRSLFDNIAYAKPSATKNEVYAAAKKAHAHEFITNLPDGYDTLVGERGVKLSGGERQRVAIARAILKNAPILLLDEATSSLDSTSEKYIQQELKQLMDGKTTVAIAHRISTIQQMDRIIVLDKGRIVEDGSHKELLGYDGIYAELWNHQTNGYISDTVS